MRRPLKSFLTLLLLFSALPAVASHFGVAPIDPLDADDVVFVVDRGGALDTGCRFRSSSPLIFSIVVDRYVGPTNADGTLKDLDTLVANKIISATARLILPAADVDDLARPSPPLQPEIDKVSFNGHPLGTFTGLNDVWVMNEFEIKMEWVKFPSAPGSPGSKPTPVLNEIRVDIDTGNARDTWCTGVDWAALQFRAMAPIFFVHGIAADSTTWDASIANFLKEQKVPFDMNINLAPNGSIVNNGRQLSKIVHDHATALGVRKVHIVAHSKGGLDTREFLGSDALYNPWDDVRVLSLHTLSTPHHGSSLADLSIARRTLNDPSSQDPLVASYLRWDWPLSFSSSVPQRPGLDDLQTSAALEFNRRCLFPLDTVLYTYSGDADLNHDGQISDQEAAPLITSFGAKFGTLMYRVLRDVSTIRVERKTSLFGLNEYHLITPVATTTPQANDIAVTDASSMARPLDTHFAPLPRNHGNIKDTVVIDNILDSIRGDYPVF